MSEFTSIEEKYAPLFNELAELVNQQPQEVRGKTRRLLGEFLHDIKHTLGLITGANAVLKRELQAESDPVQSLEMIEISDEASAKIDQYLNLLINNFSSQIDNDEII